MVKATPGADIDAMAKKYKSGELAADKIPAAKRGEVLAAAEKLDNKYLPNKKQ